MAGPEFPITGQHIADFGSQLKLLVQAQRDVAVATLTAAVVGQMNGPVSIERVLEIRTDVRWALYPERNIGPYQQWQADSADRLAKVQE